MKDDTNYGKYHIGSSWVTTQGDVATVVEICGNKQVRVSFKHPNTPASYKKTVFESNLRTGEVKNPFFPSVQGVGYLGYAYGIVTKKDAAFTAWHSMLGRCYSEDWKEKYPTYENSECAPEWHNLSTFKEWFDRFYRGGYCLDKDILVKGNKLYGPETCCLIPQALNNLLTKRESLRGESPIGVTYHAGGGKYTAQLSVGRGKKSVAGFDTEQEAFDAYKSMKESRIKELAEKYFSRQEITKEVYLALMEYTVEESD